MCQSNFFGKSGFFIFLISKICPPFLILHARFKSSNFYNFQICHFFVFLWVDI